MPVRSPLFAAAAAAAIMGMALLVQAQQLSQPHSVNSLEPSQPPALASPAVAAPLTKPPGMMPVRKPATAQTFAPATPSPAAGVDSYTIEHRDHIDRMFAQGASAASGAVVQQAGFPAVTTPSNVAFAAPVQYSSTMHAGGAASQGHPYATGSSSGNLASLFGPPSVSTIQADPRVLPAAARTAATPIIAGAAPTSFAGAPNFPAPLAPETIPGPLPAPASVLSSTQLSDLDQLPAGQPQLLPTPNAVPSTEEPFAAPSILPEPDSNPTGFDPSVVAAGQMAFSNACTQCHDANRALSKQKTLGGWLATVRRMAGKDGADIPSSDFVSIATYLAAQNPVAGGGASGAGGAAAEIAQALTAGNFTLNATVSPIWRGADEGQRIENPGFFPDVWVTAEWQNNSALSAKVTACTSCHGNAGFTFEMVEGFARLDLNRALSGCEGEICDPVIAADVKAGRFIVPFGAFSQMVHPGQMRTVTNPLMYNMGRRVGSLAPDQPVLPMPYADEGVDIGASALVIGDLSATFDAYAVNGLQGQPLGVNFNASRRYVDNNSEPALGGRATLGNNMLRFGGSIMAGNMEDEGLPSQYYQLSGGDVTFRWDDCFRAYFEYAIRRTDATQLGGENLVFGTVTEAELRLWCEPRIGLLARYDTLEHRHTLVGDLSIDRFTWGLNFNVADTLLILNHEHWIFDNSVDVDVIGIRWTAVF